MTTLLRIDPLALTRRGFLKGVGTAAGGALLAASTPRRARAATGASDRDALVCVFLPGGMDGLSAVVPFAEPMYYARRPSIAIPESQALPLDSSFGLHPAMTGLSQVFSAGDLAVVHAAGNIDATRSHFTARALWERGMLLGGNAEPGWIARHLAGVSESPEFPFRAVTSGSKLAGSLAGAEQSVAVNHLDGFGLTGFRSEQEIDVRQAIASLYAGGSGTAGALGAQARQTLDVVDNIERAAALPYEPQNGAVYPNTQLGSRLAQIARMLRAEDDICLEVACVDSGGFDTHENMGSWNNGWMSELLGDLSAALTAFYTDLLDMRDQITTVVMSEFGRQVHENGSGGCDHGSANAMLVMGGGARGGVYGDWPGLEDEDLVDTNGLAFTTDFRDVLGEIVVNRLGNPNPDAVFPGHPLTPLGLTTPRT